MTLWIFKKDIHADDGIWFDVRDLIPFFKDRGFSKHDREIYQKLLIRVSIT